MEFVEWRFQLAGLNALLVEEDALVEGFVEIPADLISALGVGSFRVGHEVERTEKYLRANRQHGSRIGQAGFGGGSFGLNSAKLLPDFGLRELIVCEQVEESIFLGLQFFELPADGRVEFGDAALFSVERFFEKMADTRFFGGGLATPA